MALSVVHAKVSAILDDPAAQAAGEVLPSDWNAAHTVTGTLPAASVTGLAAVATSGSATDLTTGTLPDARLSNTITAAGPIGSATVIPVITFDAHGRLTTVTTASVTYPGSFSGFANPSASVGLSGVNGSATTAMRSDAAPALDQGITPTWTGAHTFNNTITLASTINKLTLTSPATAATFTLANNKTFTVNNTLTLAGTDSTTMTFPATSATIARTDAGQTFTGLQTLSGAANTGLLASTGGSNTGSDQTSALDFSWTLNTSGSPNVFALRVTDTARGASTTLFNILAGAAGATSVFSVDRNGSVTAASNGLFSGSIQAGAGQAIQFAGRGILTSTATGLIQLGAANAASPVAQTLQAQGSRAGTDASTAGANLTVQSGIGTGNVGKSSLIFNGMIGAVATTSTAQTQAAGITIPGVANGQLPGAVIGSAAIATNATDGFLYIPTCAGTPTGTPTTFTGRVALVYDTTNHQFWIYDGAWLQPKTPAGAAVVNWQ